MKLEDVVLAVDRKGLDEVVESWLLDGCSRHMDGLTQCIVDAILTKLAEQGLREVVEVVEGRYDGFLHEIRWGGERMHEQHGRNIGHLLADVRLESGDYYAGGEQVAVAVLKPLPQAKEVEGE